LGSADAAPVADLGSTRTIGTRRVGDVGALIWVAEQLDLIMEKLHTWLNAQFDEKKVEPNSGLGEAIAYLLKHWEKLTLFLRKAGAPLDNNLVERALKKAILHRNYVYVAIT